MDVSMVIARLVHIVAGVFWAGTIFFVVSFLIPTVAAAGPEGGRFMQRLATQTRFTMAMGIAAGLTILSGLAMYGRVSGGFQLAWIGTGTGLALTIGGLATIAAAVTGGRVGYTGQRLGKLGKEIEANAGQPTPAQMAQLQVLQTAISQTSRLTAALLFIAVTAMAIARYIRA